MKGCSLMDLNDMQEWGCLPKIASAGDYIVKAGSRLLPRKIIYYELVYFPTQSNTVYTIGDRTYPIDEPAFIFTRPYEHHSCDHDPDVPTRHTFIHFEYNHASAQIYASRLLEGHSSRYPVHQHAS